MRRGPLRVLVVEDHAAIARQIVDFLEGLHWEADHAAAGALAIELATRETYDVVLLDLNLPDIDGIAVCRAIKAGAPRNVPVLMLTARDAFEDKARGFHGGADDYLTKPFDLRELALRCEALARRGQLHQDREIRVGSLTLRVRERCALVDGAPASRCCWHCARPARGRCRARRCCMRCGVRSRQTAMPSSRTCMRCARRWKKPGRRT
ncbi:response regulator receiver domain-containing protein [Herbaspirillum sp. SJZ107]|nr:response regulator receiver domain-containing protein [Herbaspirillum sp. SJZ107]